MKIYIFSNIDQEKVLEWRDIFMTFLNY
jgi:hypothetical protein